MMMNSSLLMAASFLLLLVASVCADTLDIEGYRPFQPEGKPLEGLVVTLDPGHGGFAHQPGYTGSARGVNSRVVENDLNILVAGILRHYLKDAGAQVHITRQDDRKVAPVTELERAQELGARTRMAVETRSHLFIAIHHNASTRASADGVMILNWPTDSKGEDQPLERILADVLRDEIEKWVHHKEKFDAWSSEHPLVSGTDIPSACVEFGFLSNPEFDAWVSQPGIHRAEARGLYEGIVRMWREHRAELEAERARLFPDAGRVESGRQRSPASGEPGASTPLKRLVKTLWPFTRPPKTEAEVNWLLEQYRASLDDSTFFHLRVTAKSEKGAWVLTGATNVPLLQTVPEKLLAAAGVVNVSNRIEVLPSERLGSKRFGVVQIPMALTWGRPAEGHDVKTQLLLGDRVFLLDQTDDAGYLLLQGSDGYCGWVRSEAVLRLDESEIAEWFNARTATLVKDEMIDDFRLPAGSSLPMQSEPDTDGKVTLRIPKGARATKLNTFVSVPATSLRFPPVDAERPGMKAAKAAAEYLTVPYVFGGRSRLGIDCSGLTGVAWSAAGLALPRDANQQVRVGRMVATPYYLPDLMPGDLVFFTDDAGRVIHAGVSLGKKRYIHASPPEVQIGSFDPADPLYAPMWHKHFAFARRPME